MKPLRKQALQVQPPQIKTPGGKEGGRFIQSGYLKWGLGVFCSGAILAAVSMWTVGLNANNANFTALDVVSKNLKPKFAGSDLQGDALEVAAVETEEALNSVLLGASYAGERMVVVGERGHILYSDDRGKSWNQANVPVRTTLTSVFFISPEKGWAVGHDTVILSTEDGGVNWSKILDGSQANAIVMQSARERVPRVELALSNATDEEKSALRDKMDFAEMALDEAVRDMGIGPSKALMDIWFADENVGLAVGASGYILRTTDGGQTWQDATESLASMDFYHFYKLVANKSGHLFLLGEGGQAYRSQDTGLSWERLSTPYEGSFFGGLSKDSDGSVYIFGMSGVVLKSIDNGDSWSQIPTGTQTILQNAALIDGDRVVIVGLGGGLIVENQQTSSFQKQNMGTRSAFTAVLAGEGKQLLALGEEGIRLYDAGVGKEDDGSIARIDSLRFMFSKRDNP